MEFLGGFCGLEYRNEFITMKEGWAVRTELEEQEQEENISDWNY